MSTSEDRVAAVLLVLVAPVLAFPAIVGGSNDWLPPVVALSAMAAAVALMRHVGLALVVGLFALAVAAGWWRSPDRSAAISHFTGIALGVFAMSTMAVWCRTRKQLTVATVAFLALGVVALSIGYRSTPAIHKRKVFLGDTAAVPPPVVPLPLSGLHARDVVNPNALSAMAMMILPVAAAVALAPAPWFKWPGVLRLAGAGSTLWAAVIVLMMQSRSAWLAGVVVGWLWMRTWTGPRLWRMATVLLFLVVPGILFALWRDHPRGAEVVATLVGRMNIWHDALNALNTSPWMGIGLDYFRHGGYSMVLWPPDQLVGVPHAHNIFLQTALDIGLVGLVTYGTLVGLLLVRAIELARSTDGDHWSRTVGVGAALSVVSVHAYGVLDAVSLGTKVGIFQWLASGLLLAAWRIHRSSGD